MTVNPDHKTRIFTEEVMLDLFPFDKWTILVTVDTSKMIPISNVAIYIIVMIIIWLYRGGHGGIKGQPWMSLNKVSALNEQS